MALDAKKPQGSVLCKVDKKTKSYMCVKCDQCMTAYQVVDGILVCLSCAKKMAGDKGINKKKGGGDTWAVYSKARSLYPR